MFHEKSYELAPPQEPAACEPVLPEEHTNRLLKQEKISEQILRAREAGLSSAGEVLPVVGVGKKRTAQKRLFQETGRSFGSHPDNKPTRLDPQRRDTVRGDSRI